MPSKGRPSTALEQELAEAHDSGVFPSSKSALGAKWQPQHVKCPYMHSIETFLQLPDTQPEELT